MKKLILLLLSCFAISCFAQGGNNTFPEPKGYVNDFEGLFTKEQQSELSKLILDSAKEADVWIVIVTVKPEQVPIEEFEKYTLELANHWGVGDKDKNNGILIAISSGYHRIRIHNGKGITPYLSDKETFDIIQAFFVPQFKENRYFEGTENGIKELIKLLSEKN